MPHKLDLILTLTGELTAALILGLLTQKLKLSPIVGYLLAGMVVGQSEFSARAASDALPMRDAFAVLFFVSVGMLFDPSTVAHGWPLMLAPVTSAKPRRCVLPGRTRFFPAKAKSRWR